VWLSTIAQTPLRDPKQPGVFRSDFPKYLMVNYDSNVIG